MPQMLPKFFKSTTLLILFRTALPASESSIAILSAGIQEAEDGPFVSTDYQFKPGEFVHVTFQVAGFSVKSEEEKAVRTVALTWEATALDSDGLPLAKPEAGEIKTELSAEDKNWTPKRRASFIIPSLVSAGDFQVHVVVKDLLANTEASKDVPFRIGGFEIQHTASITAQDVRFAREENGPPVDVPAYRPGDTIYATFAIVGFKNGANKAYHVSYGITVLRPDGKSFLEQANAAERTDSPFYPAKFVPGDFEIKTSANSPRGEYVVVLAVKDLIANRSFVTKRTFNLE